MRRVSFFLVYCEKEKLIFNIVFFSFRFMVYICIKNIVFVFRKIINFLFYNFEFFNFFVDERYFRMFLIVLVCYDFFYLFCF